MSDFSDAISRGNPDPLVPTPSGSRRSTVAVSNAPWGDTSSSDYPTVQAFAKACLMNLNTGPSSTWTKANCKLPVYEPGGALNRNAVHAAAAVLAGGRGGVDAPPDAKRAAARKLIGLYRELDETPPDSLKSLAG